MSSCDKHRLFKPSWSWPRHRRCILDLLRRVVLLILQIPCAERGFQSEGNVNFEFGSARSGTTTSGSSDQLSSGITMHQDRRIALRSSTGSCRAQGLQPQLILQLEILAPQPLVGPLYSAALSVKPRHRLWQNSCTLEKKLLDPRMPT
jgi:hypothetical protein